jgi:hypothetical protein
MLRFDLPLIETTRRQELGEPGTARLSLRALADGLCRTRSRSSCHPVVFHSSSPVYDASGSKNGNAPPATLRFMS